MKITITTEEILSVLSKHTGMTVTEFVIEMPLADRLRSFIKQYPHYQFGDKISAIKALRDLNLVPGNPMGLADAKWAIENWNNFLRFVETTNRLPKAGWNHSGML